MTMKRPALLVGSVNLASAQEVFTTAGDVLGGCLRSVPDGETGERLQWFSWQVNVMERAPFLRKARGDAEYARLARYGVNGDLSDARFDTLGYADAAIASYAIFAALRDQGKIPAGVRFQVSLPTPLAPMMSMIEADDLLKVEPLYEDAMRREIERMCGAIPADDLAIQWDVASELSLLEGLSPLDGKCPFSDPRNDMARRLAKIIGWVPAQAAVGIHLCYGDYEHKHFIEPKDTGLMVDFANAVFERVSRRVDWLHLPVPKDRDDDAYFAPLEKLELPAGTQLYLGLVHYTDGLEGGRRRMEAAGRHVSDFGVSTECGLGRRPAETIPDVMKLMATLASA
ncbi:MAG TPA: hypothetical protein VJ859_05680 [Allosphingosinicella sp.]|nr:hypothetical protein [Allosphingosinicella sp.]